MINVAAVLSLRNLPPMAEFGWSSIGWYLIGTITFLIPLSMAGAELATGWPKGGGVYAWVKEAFGDTSGFIAVFCEWSNDLVWFPTILAFLASTLAFAIDPALSSNGLYMFTIMMIIFWGTTLIALLGSKFSSRYSSIGVVIGTLVPADLSSCLASYTCSPASRSNCRPSRWAPWCHRSISTRCPSSPRSC